MMRARAMVLVAALLLAVPAGAAVTASISGDWELTVVVEPMGACTYVGPLTLVQNGAMFSGSTTVSLVLGTIPPCLASFSGAVSGNLTGFVIDFGVATGVGMGTFDGMVGADELTMSGTWTLGTLTGTWSAERVLGVGAPTMNTAGLAGLLVLLLAAGVFAVRRRAV